MMKYDLGQDKQTNWLVAETAFDMEHQGKCESIFCAGNGYLGQRAAFEEDYAGQTRGLFVNGTFNRFDQDEVTELPNLPDVTRMEIHLNGKRFFMDNSSMNGYLRTLDLYTAESCRTLEWQSPSGERFALRFSRFASLDNEHLLAQKMEITPLSANLSVTVESGINGRMTNEGSQHFHQGDMRVLDDRVLRMVSQTTQSKVSCCLHTAHRFLIGGKEVPVRQRLKISRRKIDLLFSVEVPMGCTLVVEKISAVTTSRDLAFVNEANAALAAEQAGHDLLRTALSAGYDRLFAESAARWADFWAKNDVVIDCEHGFDQLLIRFALYHLNIMAKKGDGRMGIGAKGLTGEGYKGHSFWDTEIFLLPFYTFTQPETARKLLEYRYHGLQGARAKARENGFEGAMYPWEAAWVDDGEVTPLWKGTDPVSGTRAKVLTGLIEQHITADVAFGVQQYALATGDQDFMDRYGYEMIIDTARFWVSRCEWDESRHAYVLTDVIGPDEYKVHVDNNAYTNYMAAFNLDLGVQVIDGLVAQNSEVTRRLNAQFDLKTCRQQMAAVSAKLYRPQPDENGIVPQFDGIFDLKPLDLTPYKQSEQVDAIRKDYSMDQLRQLQVHKQADTLLLMLLMDHLFPAEVKKQSFDYYEPHTLHASSLSKSTHCVLAADLGNLDMAYHFYQSCGAIDLGPVMSTSDAGVHTASMGGIWQNAVYGFGGVRVRADELHIQPRLPAAWRSLSFSILWQGQRLQVNADHAGMTVANRGCGPAAWKTAGKAYVLAAGEVVQISF